MSSNLNFVFRKPDVLEWLYYIEDIEFTKNSEIKLQIWNSLVDLSPLTSTKFEINFHLILAIVMQKVITLKFSDN